MQINTALKLGMAALVSVMMAACASNDISDTTLATTGTTPAVARTSGADNNGGLTAEQIRARDAALAKTIFYFEYDRAELSQEDRDALTYHAANLKADPTKRIRLEGHADERGTREYNLALGERRAQAVERYLGSRCCGQPVGKHQLRRGKATRYTYHRGGLLNEPTCRTEVRNQV